ncbi:MAG: extracellular matrix/biofilm regulator RemA [Faecousia sp.]
MAMRLINIGFGNMVSAERLLSVVSPESAPIKRLVQEAKERSMLIDASFGRKTRAVLVMDTDHVILSAITPEAIAKRLSDKEGETYRDEEEPV